MTRFSIVTVTFNAERVVGRTLGSVLAQRGVSVEHIIVDGASGDATMDIVAGYVRESALKAPGNEVRVVSEPDGGVYDAMNKGLRMATGDYVCFLNAGDWLPGADTLSTIAANARLDGIREGGGPLPAVLYGDTDIVDAEGNVLGPRRLRPPRELSWRSFMHGMLVCHQAFYARVDIAREVPYDLSLRLSSDVDWCIRVMKRAEEMSLPLANVGATVANYQRDGLSTRRHGESLWERFLVMRRHYGLATAAAMHLWFALRALCPPCSRAR